MKSLSTALWKVDKKRPIRVPSDLEVQWRSKSLMEIIQRMYLVVKCDLGSTYPRWCWCPEGASEPFCRPGDPIAGPDCLVVDEDTGEEIHWCSKNEYTTWTPGRLDHRNSMADFYAHATGSRVQKDEWISNCAKWAWRFTAEEDEEVEIDVDCFLSGLCSWRGGGDVTLWIRGSLRVISLSPDDPDPYLDIEPSIRLSYSTHGVIDEPPPQGCFGGDAQSHVTFSPTASNPRIRVRADHTYVVVAAATPVLMANFDAAIVLGDLSTVGDRPMCRLKALCRIWKTAV